MRSYPLPGLLALVLLAGCTSPPATQVPSLISGLFNRPTDQDRCLQTYRDAEQWLPAAVADNALKAVERASLAGVDWEQVFTDAAHQAGVRKVGLVLVDSSGEQAALFGVDWCYGLAGYDLYVIDGGGQSWKVGSETGIYYQPQIEWLDGVWGILVRDYASSVNFLFVTLVGQQNGEWAAIYRSDHPATGFVSLTWQSTEPIDVWFEEGYRYLFVVWKRPSDGRRIRMQYEWQDGGYVYVAASGDGG